MVLAMHHIQVACIARHGLGSPFFQGYLREVRRAAARSSRSITSEVGVWGDTRSSICARRARGRPLQARQGRDHRLVRRARRRSARHVPPRPRRAAERSGAGAGAQARIARSAQTATWDTLGMRGTCSPGFKLVVVGPERADPARLVRRRVGADDGVVLAHPVVGACGSASRPTRSARASAFVRAEARKKPGHRAAEGARAWPRLSVELQTMRNNVHGAGGRVRRDHGAPNGMEELLTVGWALKMNNLKVALVRGGAARSSTRRCRSSASAATRTTRSSRSGRHYRDALSAALMISNDRIFAKTRVDAARVQGRVNG